MAIFDQRGQQVNYQYNAAGDINFGAIQTRAELIAELEKLIGEINTAASAKAIDTELATDVEYQVTKAAQQAKKPEPDKKGILDHLATAMKLIEGVTTASGMVTAIAQAIQLVQRLF